jgi:hypothetical protein
MSAVAVSLVAIELLTDALMAVVGVAGELAALLVRCVATKVVKRPKAAELYQALCGVWSGVDE